MAHSVICTVLASAASYNLATLAQVKTELSIGANDTSNDAFLSQAITQVSKSIARECKRAFVPEFVQDIIDFDRDPYFARAPGGFSDLGLSRWPVIAIFSVVQSLPNGTTQTLVAGTDYRLDPISGRLFRLSYGAGQTKIWESLPLTVTYLAGYGSQATEAHAVPAGANPQVTVSQASMFSCDVGVTYASGTPLTSVTANPAQGQYSVAAGGYTFNTADAGQILTFTYGTAGVPEDITEICLELITGRFRAKDRDPTLMQTESPMTGVQRFWIGASAGQSTRFAPDQQAALNRYRVPSIA